MNRTIVAGVSLALLALPAGAAAEPTDADRQNAAQECRSERGTSDDTRKGFASKYGTNENDRNAFGKCVSSRAVDEEKENKAAKTNAAKECKAEREMGAAAFREKYGTGKNGRNAFGKCVSGKAKAKMSKADLEDAEKAKKRQNAAKQCAAAREGDKVAFAEKYGTESNAFGKCVSALAAKAQNDEA